MENGMIYEKILNYCMVLQFYFWVYTKRQWQPSPVLSPGKCHGWRSLVGYSPQGRKELDMTEQFHFQQLLASRIMLAFLSPNLASVLAFKCEQPDTNIY